MEQRRTDEAAAQPAASTASAESSGGTLPAAAGEPGIGAIAALAFVVVMVPGILLYVVLRAFGLAIGPAGLLGLLVMFVCVFAYPVLLRRLGWVGRR